MPLLHSTYYPGDNFSVVLSRVQEVSFDELMDELYAGTLHEDWVPGMRVLVDFRSLTKIVGADYKKSYSKSNNLGSDIEQRLGNGHKSVLCSSDHIFALFRQFYSFRSTRDLISVCRDLDEALAWISIKDGAKFGIE